MTEYFNVLRYMLDQIQQRFRATSLGLLIGPPILCLVVLTALLVHSRMVNHEAEFAARANEQVARLDELLRTESVRVSTLAQLPQASAIAQAAQRRDTQRVSDENQLELQWERSTREDAMVRGVLDNDLSTLFNRLMGQDRVLTGLLVADTQGALLAATEKTPRFIQRNEPWWRPARELPPGTVSASGITTDGRTDVAAPIIQTGSRGVVDGLLHARIDLAELARKAGIASTDEVVLFVLGGSAPWIVGDANALDSRATRLADKLYLKVDPAGHLEGYRYINLPLNGGMLWTNSPRAIFAVSEAERPLGVLLPPGIMFLILAGALIAIAVIAVPVASKLFFAPLEETNDAGIWIMRTALSRGGVGGRTSEIQKELAGWFAQLQQELQRRDSAIAADIARDLEMATEFQQAFLNRPPPDIPEVHMQGRLRLEFYHRYQPALAMGGDFFDITPLATDTAGVFIGDVMGHGTRSALIVAILRTLIAEQSRRGRNAPHFLRELNNEFCNILKTLPTPIFASAAYFVADTTSRIATYSVAGHPPPFQVHRALGRVTRVEVPKPQGAALGLLPSEEYGGSSIRMNDGDSFIFFTDGVYEASNISGEEFGLARLEKIIRANVYRGSREILDSVMEAVTLFAGSQPLADDICLLAVDVTTTERRA